MDRRLVGRQNKAAGDLFEAWTEVHYERALALGIVVHPVEHNQPKSRVVHGKVIYTGKGLADRTGLLANGKTLAVEEKSTSKDYLPRKVIQPKQAAYLDAIARQGHVALLLLEFRLEKRVQHRRFAVPWQDVPWQKKRTADRVVWSDLEPWQILLNEHCFLMKFCQERVAPPAVLKRVFPRT